MMRPKLVFCFSENIRIEENERFTNYVIIKHIVDIRPDMVNIIVFLDHHSSKEISFIDTYLRNNQAFEEIILVTKMCHQEFKCSKKFRILSKYVDAKNILHARNFFKHSDYTEPMCINKTVQNYPYLGEQWHSLTNDKRISILKILNKGKKTQNFYLYNSGRDVRFCCFQAYDWSFVTFLAFQFVERANSNTSEYRIT